MYTRSEHRIFFQVTHSAEIVIWFSLWWKKKYVLLRFSRMSINIWNVWRLSDFKIKNYFFGSVSFHNIEVILSEVLYAISRALATLLSLPNSAGTCANIMRGCSVQISLFVHNINYAIVETWILPTFRWYGLRNVAIIDVSQSVLFLLSSFFKFSTNVSETGMYEWFHFLRIFRVSCYKNRKTLYTYTF